MRVSFYAAVFNVVSLPIARLGGARVLIRPGAFRQAIRLGGVRLTVDHAEGLSVRSLVLREDSRGLLVRAELVDVAAGRRVAKAIERGRCQGASLDYRWATWASPAWLAWPDDVRELVNVRSLVDVALMIDSRPAFPQTRPYVAAIGEFARRRGVKA